MKGYSFRSLTDLVLKIFKTEVNAGTGLSGGGSLEADRTLSVKYGTAAGTATQGNDSRLSNSREWTAATIGQAETEAGTATTRRAFTAQRVRQAIVAWWNSITGAFGRDLVTSASSTVARDKLGLFTSALRWPAWAEVSGKPTTFPSSSHTHPWTQVTGQPVTATRWPSYAEVTGKPTTFPPSSHTHAYLPLTGGTITGNLTVNGTVYGNSTANFTDVYIRSDIRDKKNFDSIDNALDKVNTLTGLTYDVLSNTEYVKSAGLIAQDVQKILPNAVGISKNINDEDRLTLSYNAIVALLVESVKELTNRVEELEKK